MGFTRFAGLLCIVPSVMMLVASFFVLFAVGKTEGNGLKLFGKIIQDAFEVSDGDVVVYI